MYCEKVLKNCIKLLKSPFQVMLQTFLLEEHSKGTWAPKGHSRVTQRALEYWNGTPRALQGHSRHSGTQVLEAFRHSKVLWHLGSQSTWALRHLSTQALEGYLGTQAIGHSGT